MKNKNIGKVRPPKGSSLADKTPLHHGAFDQAKVCPKMLLQVGNELSGLASPCEMTSQARVFVHDCKYQSPRGLRHVAATARLWLSARLLRLSFKFT